MRRWERDDEVFAMHMRVRRDIDDDMDFMMDLEDIEDVFLHRHRFINANRPGAIFFNDDFFDDGVPDRRDREQQNERENNNRHRHNRRGRFGFDRLQRREAER